MYKSKKRLQNSKLFTRNRIDIYMGDIQSLRYWGITCDFAGPLTQFWRMYSTKACNAQKVKMHNVAQK